MSPDAARPRWWSRLRRAQVTQDLDPRRPDLVVVASGFDDTEACSAALERAASTEPRWDPSRRAVIRHHLLLPADRHQDAVAVAGQDGYAAADPPPHEVAGGASLPVPHEVAGGAPLPVPDGRLLVLQRVEVLDALHCSQERSRMAGLAQLRGGHVLGWDALQPPPG
ncbi:MAG: hypothetical protein ABI776_16905 [Nocardioidaceae bacterium]